MQKLFDILSQEHKEILSVVNKLDKEIEKEEINNGEIEKIINFIVNYADKFHHAKEEDLLFIEFEKSLTNGIVCNPIKQMILEHEEGRKFVKKMKEGLKENNPKKLISNSKAYSDLIREHIFKEDNILFPMADKIIDNNKKDKILIEFNKIKLKNI